MATDIMDKDLKALRNARWEKAFKKDGENKEDCNSSSSTLNEDSRDAVNRKATIVIEHIIQASDISHTVRKHTPHSTAMTAKNYSTYPLQQPSSCLLHT